MRSSPKFSHEPLNEFFYDLETQSFGDDSAYIDGVVCYSLFRFTSGMNPSVIDEYNEEKDSFEDQLNAEEIVLLCAGGCGAILKQTDDGFVDATVYTDQDELEARWSEIQDDCTLEECDECQATAAEYGRGNLIEHDSDCSLAEAEAEA